MSDEIVAHCATALAHPQPVPCHPQGGQGCLFVPWEEQERFVSQIWFRTNFILKARQRGFGGSYIGLEFAQIYRRFGSEVTIVERGSRLIGREDPEISDAIADILRAEGIAVRLGAECIHLARTRTA